MRILRFEDLNDDIRRLRFDRLIVQLNAETSKELGDHREYEESKMCRFFYRASGRKEEFEDKASKERSEYVKARNAERQAKSRRDTLVKNRAIAKQRHTELEDDVEKHNDLQAKLDTLYDLIFEGHTPDLPGEDARELAFREARHTFNATKQRSEAELQAVEYLEDAKKLMQEAVQQLSDVSSHSTLDIFSRRTSSGMMQQEALNKAQDATNQIHTLVAQAESLSSGAQGLGSTNVAEEHVISDVFFEDIFSDVATGDNTLRTRIQCEQKVKKIQRLITSTKGRSDQCKREADEAAERLASCRRELQEIRQEAFAEAPQPPSYEESLAIQQNA